MKNAVFILTITAFIAGTMLTGCQWMDKQKQTTQDNLKEAKNNVLEVKQDINNDLNDSIQQYKKLYAKKIKANEESMAKLKMNVDAQKRVDRAAYEQKLALLEQRNSDLKKKLEDFKATGNDSWEKFKLEFNHDMNELGKAFSDIAVNNVK